VGTDPLEHFRNIDLLTAIFLAVPTITTFLTFIITLLLRRDQIKLHTMVNSQQTDLNRISQAAETRAGVAEGTLAGLREGFGKDIMKDLQVKIEAVPLTVAAVIAEPKLKGAPE
jgi:hypothetical protein